MGGSTPAGYAMEWMLFVYFAAILAIGQFFYWVMRLDARRKGKEDEFLGKFERDQEGKIK